MLKPFQSFLESCHADLENQAPPVTVYLSQRLPHNGRQRLASPWRYIRLLQLGESAGGAPRGSLLAAN